jgi:hypothetical protein
MDAQISDTSMGLMKALHFIQLQQRRKPKPKFRYESAGTAVRAKNFISRKDRTKVLAILQELKTFDPSQGEVDRERIKQLFSDLGKLPVNLVPVKHQIRIDRSKTYPYRSKKRGG